ncbi:MAG: hypothetical protein K2R98_10055 [Gemmataceae bacterium]|nr:hypothetical protein [Gemmataceae bacterium]
MNGICERTRIDKMKPARGAREGNSIPSLAPGAGLARNPYRWRIAALALGGYLLFAHGCHGDEDNELFAVLRQHVTAWFGR